MSRRRHALWLAVLVDLGSLVRLELASHQLAFGGRICAPVARKARGARSLDLPIAAAALAADLPLYPNDFRGIEDLVNIVIVEPAI